MNSIYSALWSLEKIQLMSSMEDESFWGGVEESLIYSYGPPNLI